MIQSRRSLPNGPKWGERNESLHTVAPCRGCDLYVRGSHKSGISLLSFVGCFCVHVLCPELYHISFLKDQEGYAVHPHGYGNTIYFFYLDQISKSFSLSSAVSVLSCFSYILFPIFSCGIGSYKIYVVIINLHASVTLFNISLNVIQLYLQRHKKPRILY